MGKAGIKLNRPNIRLTVIKSLYKVSKTVPSASEPNPTNPSTVKKATIAKLTAGPASAINSSAPGARGIRRSLATPPIG